MADDLFRVFKSVRKLVREKTEDLFGNISPLERTLREVTDEDTCAVSNSLLRHIALSTNDAYAYSTVAQVVWQGISSEFWQRIYKCLCLLEYMILLGPERCRQDCANAQLIIRSLSQYRFHDGRREQGGGVRQRAENILRLINDPVYWRNAKEQAIKDSEKYAGGIENQPYISPMSQIYNSNPFFSGPAAVPPFPLTASSAGPFSGVTVRPAFPASPTKPIQAGPRLSSFYDPVDDAFNTTDPFAQNAPTESAPEQPVPLTRPKPATSLLDDDDLFADTAPAPARAEARTHDLLE